MLMMIMMLGLVLYAPLKILAVGLNANYVHKDYALIWKNRN